MKKKMLIILSIIGVAGILTLATTCLMDSASDEDRARQNLISIIESIDRGSNDSDYINKDGSQLVIRNSRTREFILKVLATATAEEVTGTANKPWPTPFYYVSGEYIGGNLILCSSYNNRTFFFFLDDKDQAYFYTYILAIEQAGELFGIECTDNPSYLDVISNRSST